MAVTGVLPILVAGNEAMFPEPLAPKPMDVSLLVQLYTVPGTDPMKLMADVGLVGLPNAGKSTLLSVVSNAKPEIADYAFTTLTPHLGVADIDDTTLLIADIPGLIEGASIGKGLGHDFLRHVERTGVLLHLVDAYSNNIAKDYKVIRKELESYSDELAQRPEVVAITKTEGLDEEMTADLLSQLQAVVLPKTLLFAISSQSHKNIRELLRALRSIVDTIKAQKAQEELTNETETPVFSLDADKLAWNVEEISKNTYSISGHKIEKFARRTDFESFHGLQRLRDIMKKMGIQHELIRRGAQPDSLIIINKSPPFHLVDQDEY